MAKRSLAGSRTIVTGASSGIGWHIVRQLALAGGHTVACARRQGKLQELAAEVNEIGRKTGAKLVFTAGDITNPEVRSAARQQAVTSFGGLDAVVNNAGVGSFGQFVDSSEARLRQIMEINFFAAVEMTRESIPFLKRGNNPIITNISSILGHRGIPRMGEYCSSKFAMTGWSESLRIELGAMGIDVLLVSPGTTETDFYDSVVHGRGKVPWNKGKGVTAEAVAKATVRAIAKGKREIIPNRAGKWLVWANNRAPGIVDRFMRKFA